MKFSAAEEYGVRCLVRLARAFEDGRATTIPEVARDEGLSPEYVAKLLSTLRRGGLVRTERGVNGGVRLSRPPQAITLTDAFAALTGAPVRAGHCVGHAGATCDRAADCTLRSVWGALEGVVMDVLSQVTILDLVRGDGVGRLPALLRAGGTWKAIEGKTA